MAAGASCLISLSSRSRALEPWSLVVGIVSPTTPTAISALPTGSTHCHKIVSDDAPANVSFKSDFTLVKGSLHAKAVFERAQARFNACSPTLATTETSAVSVAPSERGFRPSRGTIHKGRKESFWRSGQQREVTQVGAQAVAGETRTNARRRSKGRGQDVRSY